MPIKKDRSACRRDRINSLLVKKNNPVLNLKILEKKKFNFLEELKQRFPSAEIFLVGGAVRGLLLSRKTQDYDFVIRRVKVKVLEEFLNSQGKVNLVGQTFGVFKFIPKRGDKQNPFDIALPRKDFSLGTGGYRDVEIQTSPGLSIKKDLSRRDFTINAMALKWEKFDKRGIGHWQIIDPYHGIEDLKKKIIRAVRDPKERFKEDYSRMLRAIRFACQLDFKIEEDTWKALKSQMKFINKISREVKSVSNGKIVEPKVIEKRVVPYEVIAKEFLKTFMCQPVQAFDLYDQSGGFKELIPEVLKMKNCPQPENYHMEGDVWEHTRLSLEKLSSTNLRKKCGKGTLSNEVIIATLFHDLGKPYTIQTPEEHGTDRIRFNEHDVIGAQKARDIAKRLKLSSPDKVGIDIDEMAWLIEQHMVLIKGDITKMRPRTIEKYFFNSHYSGQKLLQISFADISATITKKGPLSFDKFDQMLERIYGLKELSESKKELPKPLITGDDIMKEFNLSPGPQVGRLLESVRTGQLSKKIKNKEQALNFLKKKNKKKS
ncbi:HD domain-containing protein [Patescibacteria group bacterium]|nr:HD domain-containing protein [Patescibacteria group bacterium]